MARETKAARLAREQAEREALFEAFCKSYPKMLFNLLEQACEEGAELTVREGKYVLRFYGEEQLEVKMPRVATDWTDEARMQDVVYHVQAMKRERLAREERARVRTEALAKLTKEEKEALGLK